MKLNVNKSNDTMFILIASNDCLYDSKTWGFIMFRFDSVEHENVYNIFLMNILCIIQFWTVHFLSRFPFHFLYIFILKQQVLVNVDFWFVSCKFNCNIFLSQMLIWRNGLWLFGKFLIAAKFQNVQPLIYERTRGYNTFEFEFGKQLM